MLRRIAVVLLLALLLSMPALAQAPRDDRTQMRQEMMQRWQGMNQTQQQHALEHAEMHGLFGRLTYDAATGMAVGGFLRFHVAASAGAIHDVRVRANRTLALTPLFAGVTPSSFTLVDGPTVHGAALALDGNTLDLMAHNNPTAGLTWHADAPVTLTFQLAPGLHAFFPAANQTHEARILVGTTHAHLVTNGAAGIQLSNGNATATVTLAANDTAMVRLHPVGDVAAGGLHDMLAAFRARRLGATLRVANENGTAAEDGEAADVQATTREIGRGRAVFDISSTQHNGRVLFLTVDNGTVDPSRLDAVMVTLGGASLRKVGTTSAVVSAADGAYALVRSDDGKLVTVAVAVPHFSSYALAITQPLATGGSGGTSAAGGSSGSTGGASGAAGGSSQGSPALGLMALAGALGVALLLRRRA